MFENEKNKILTCFFQAVFFSRKKLFFSEKNKLVFFGLQPYPQYKKNVINLLKNKNYNKASNSEAVEWRGRVG